ncbi:MAG TPA: UDP-N-acetylmuramoyl-L-alanyl-D-glutamate--2,6-diaminopimelate ligase [Solirubrobacteraceae bacterium]|nr:UDP-N-acetylmuramoyl-L-alanyl-D-glutamate--2,6-diaminopimelate ligase [Solirubrobacteraceae bacterium]
MDLDVLFPDAAAVDIGGLTYDNRLVGPRDLFFCVRGFNRDGHDFAGDVVQRGAAALVVDHLLDLDIPQVVVQDVRRAMPPAAATFYGKPTESLDLVGITGTNGKTTTAYLVRALLEADGRQTGLLGTVKSVIGGTELPVERTTPEAIDLQRSFREMLDTGDVACVMEVSSHALELGRVAASRFAVGVFTNLTQDHLDFHPTMEDYFQAKRRLFTEIGARTAVLNLDDPYGLRLATDPEIGSPITFAFDHPGATYRADDVRTGLGGSRFVLHSPDGVAELRSPLRGRFNVSNVMAAFAAARALGVPFDTVVAAVEGAGQVPGRFETVDEGQRFAVLVDYAHTPDSLENVLSSARNLSAGRLHVVFGCGGDRDRKKRPLMGEIAARIADRVFVTSDNPRSEDPEAIIAEILAGIDRPVEHNADRRAAIFAAVAEADEGDVVVIAGKGHEQGQEFAAGEKLPFDDVSVARAALRQALGGAR